MDLQRFINAVSEMRKHQKAYFRDRKQSDLIKAKEFEKVVDEGLATGLTSVERVGFSGVEQIELFNEAME